MGKKSYLVNLCFVKELFLEVRSHNSFNFVQIRGLLST